MKTYNISVTLDSILDTRSTLYDELNLETDVDYRIRLVDDERVRELYLNRSRDLVNRTKHTTNIHRLLMYIKTLLHTEALKNNQEPNIIITVNTYPYNLNMNEMNLLKKGLAIKYTFADELEVVTYKPTLEYLKKQDYYIDYELMFTLNDTMSNLEGKDNTAIMSAINGLDKVTLVSPAIFYDQLSKDEMMRLHKGAIKDYFDRLSKEYEPITTILFVDIGFFTKDVKIQKGEKDEHHTSEE